VKRHDIIGMTITFRAGDIILRDTRKGAVIIKPMSIEGQQMEALLDQGGRVLNAYPAGAVIGAEIQPTMVEIPAGSFRMGDLSGGGLSDERPVREVVFARPFALGRYPVTFEEYDRFAQATGRDLPSDQGWGRGRRPVINVSWDDAMAYCQWLSAQTGQTYRLPSEAEWEYACRAGTTTEYSWGDDIGCNHTNCLNSGSQCSGKRTAPVGSFEHNPWGLYDMHGNVWEWCADCWNNSYRGAPSDGSAWTNGKCERRVLRGGSWSNIVQSVRAAYRFNHTTSFRYNGYGFRVAKDLS
jgi:formylglycine-generating enzyme required for sulfatase activity